MGASTSDTAASRTQPAPAAGPDIAPPAQRYRTVLLFGGPGAGKGTQGKMIGALPGFYHVATGDVFRAIDLDSELGKIFRHYSTRGELVPDDVTVKVWAQAMNAHTVLSDYKPRQDLLVLDGIPRTVAQAQIMDRYIDVLKIVHLVCRDREAMYERLKKRALKEKRTDDANDQVVRRRWAVYDAETAPVLGYYPKDKIAEVNAVGALPMILSDILAVLAPLQQQHFAADAK